MTAFSLNISSLLLNSKSIVLQGTKYGVKRYDITSKLTPIFATLKFSNT